MNFSKRKTYKKVLGIMVFAMVPVLSFSQATGFIHSNSFSTDNQNGVRAFDRSDVLQTNFLRDSSQTFEITGEYGNLNWELRSSTSYAYDYLGNEMSRVFKSVENQTWRNTNRQDNLYHLGSELTERIESEWSTELGEWAAVYKYQYAYNYLGQDREILGFEHVDDAWIPNHRIDSEYDSNNFISRKTDYYWDQSLAVWVANSRILFTYNEKSSLSQEVNQVWNDSLRIWVNNFSRVYVYNDDNMVTSTTRRAWSDLVEGWVSMSMLSLQYNDKGQLSGSERNEILNDDIDSQPQFLESASYGVDGNLGEVLLSEWNVESETWDSYEKELHFWAAHIHGNKNSVRKDIDCRFANPYLLGLPLFCENLKPDVEYTVEVYDLYGRMFYTKSFAWNATFRLNGNIPPGFYNIVIRGGLDYHAEKILIRN